jgi:hypothetical protein
MLHQFIITVPHVSADHLIQCLPYFPQPPVNCNIKSFFIQYQLCILCPKYFNFLLVANVSRECLGIIWSVTDVFILLPVHGIISISFICFSLHPYSTAGKTVVCSRLTFVLIETPSLYAFCQIFHSCFAQAYSFVGFFVGVAAIGDKNQQKLTVDYCADIFTI